MIWFEKTNSWEMGELMSCFDKMFVQVEFFLENNENLINFLILNNKKQDDFNKNKKIRITTISSQKSGTLKKKTSTLSPLLKNSDDRKALNFNEFLVANNLGSASIFANRYRPDQEIKQEL